MRVAVCQERVVGNFPSRETLIDYWKSQLENIPIIDSLTFHDVFTPQRAPEIFRVADVVLGVNIVDDYFDEKFFSTYPDVKYVSTHAHGYGRIDGTAAQQAGVTFTNTLYGQSTVAQYTMALLLEICHGTYLQSKLYQKHVIALAKGADDELKIARRQYELANRTIGIVGLGNIGFEVAKMAKAFNMKVIGYNRTIKEGPEYDFIEQVSLDTLYQRSDVISLHCALVDDTYHLLDESAFAKMKDQVILINTARGAIIDEVALVAALESGKIYAAGLDVVENEPLTAKHPLMDYEQVLLTPHIAWLSEASRYRTIEIAVDNFKSWLKGSPKSTII